MVIRSFRMFRSDCPTDGGKPCGAVLLDEQVVQHLLLFIAEGEKELGEKAVSCQLVQLIGIREDDIEKISLTELTEPRQIHPQRSNLRIRHRLKLQRNIPAQVFVVTLPALPVPVQLVPLIYHSQKIRFCPGRFLQPPQSLCADFPLESFFAGGRGLVFLVLVIQLGGIVSGMLVLLQLAFQLQSTFLGQCFLQTLVLRRTVRSVHPLGKAVRMQKMQAQRHSARILPPWRPV